MTEEQKKTFKIINGNSLDVLDTIKENSIDAIITDPPYELGFMGKSWDKSGIAYNVELWQKAFRVLKPGAYLLAFGGSRTYHRIACAIEDAGFYIKDCIMWLYGSGFPKSMNIGLAIDKKNGVESINKGAKYTSPHWKDLYNVGIDATHERKMVYEKQARNQWNGWGTCLKPSYEPIIVAQKPVEKTIVENIKKYGVGGINIDECRVPFEETPNPATNPKYRKNAGYKLPEKGQESNGAVSFTSSKNETNDLGRFPANTILTYDDNDFNEVCGGMPNTQNDNNNSYEGENASRYFYCAKASKKDRDEGLELFEEKQTTDGCIRSNAETARKFGANSSLRKNIHPTVKPVELMQYLVRLITPPNGIVLDIFNGSGSTGKAVAFENRERDANYKYIGIELDKQYCEISYARIDHALNKFEYDILEQIKEIEREENGDEYEQYDLFGEVIEN